MTERGSHFFSTQRLYILEQVFVNTFESLNFAKNEQNLTCFNQKSFEKQKSQNQKTGGNFPTLGRTKEVSGKFVFA